ncbi:hypothetical protein CDL15_Pgr022064 [Punica granatum]|uniref:Uncharacterized protein n=1 Tax=Punica granatum TaxID=22663 RepID=A0A218VSQ3_PUNGR|nr:hypothetical protein CDL15_Pgr022064 [Punica granatum]
MSSPSRGFSRITLRWLSYYLASKAQELIEKGFGLAGTTSIESLLKKISCWWSDDGTQPLESI